MTDGETGVLVKPRSVDALAEALRATDWEGFDVARLRAAAERFSESRFRERFMARCLGNDRRCESRARTIRRR